MKPIVSRITVEVLGGPQEHVEKAMLEVVKKIKEDKEVKVRVANVYECTQLENKLWSTFADIEFETRALKKVLDICYDYTPSVVEILEPAGLEVNTNEIAELLNDFLHRIHKYSMVLKKLQTENVFMVNELERIKNNVVVPLKTTKEEKE